MAWNGRRATAILLTDPKQLLTVVQAGLGLAVLFGAPLSPEQIGGIVIFLSSLILWLNSMQPSPKDLDELTKAAEGAVRAKNLELNEVKAQAASAIEGSEP